MRHYTDETELAYRRPSAPPADPFDLFSAATDDLAVADAQARVGAALDPVLSVAVRDAVLAKHEVDRSDRLTWLRGQLEQLARRRAAAGQAPTLTGDDAWALWQAHPDAKVGEPAAWLGSVFRDARFTWTGRLVKSARVSNKASDLRVWVLTGAME